MKQSTKILHGVIKFLKIESMFIFVSRYFVVFKKTIPLKDAYTNPTIKKVTRDKANFILNISDYMQWHIWADMKDLSWKLAIQYAKENSTIIDVGANVGAFTLKTASALKSINSQSTVIAFEPNPFVFEALSSNLKYCPGLSDNTTIVPVGLSENKGELMFQWHEDNSGGGHFVFNKEKIYANTETIKVVSLDEYITEHNVTYPSFIKIDVEGFEPYVIKGASKTIEQHKPDLFVEISPGWWLNNGFTVYEVLSFFEKLGYFFYPVIEEELANEASLDELTNLKYQFNLYITFHQKK